MKKHFQKILRLILLVFVLLGLYACQQSEGVGIETTTPTPTLPPGQEAIWEKWEGSQHADTYSLEKGPNTYCASCHSPKNWDYAAKIDPPPNCVSCKFSFEDEPRIAPDNPLVAQEDWANIGCDVCHQMNGRLADPEYYWYDNATRYYEVVDSTTELCQKCHQDKDEFLHHRRELGDQVHQGFSCTECHDPHDPYASCGDCHIDIVLARGLPAQQHLNISDKSQCLRCHTNGMDAHSMEVQRTGEKDCLVCHEEFANLSDDNLAPAYHSSVHRAVPCSVCHDALGLSVGLVEGQDTWVTFRSVEMPFPQPEEPYSSHNLTTAVDCTRCHYANNPWGVPESLGKSN